MPVEGLLRSMHIASVVKKIPQCKIECEIFEY